MTARRRPPLTPETRAQLVTMLQGMEDRMHRLDRSADRLQSSMAALREALGEEEP